MTFEAFSRGNSLCHRLDTRVKLLSTLGPALVIALCHNFLTAFAGLAMALILLLSAGLDIHQVLRRLVVVNTFVGFLWLTLPLTYPGDPLALGPLHLSSQGIELAALITLKTNSIILVFIALPATSTVAELGHGMEALGVPRKLCLLLLFSYRYIFVIHQEYQRLSKAARLRCFAPATNRHTYQTYGHLLGMTVIKSWTRAERVKQAMLLRGFHGHFYSLDEQTLTRTDLIFLVSISLGTVLLICLETVFK